MTTETLVLFADDFEFTPNKSGANMWKLTAGHFAGALLAGTALSPAMAQDVDLPIPPSRQTLDENGVNLVTGNLQVSDPQITIGGSQGLSFRRYSPGSTGVWSQQYTYAVYGVPGSNVVVVVDDRSIAFDYLSGSYVNKAGSGETLVRSGSTWLFTLRDGTLVDLDLAGFPTGAGVYRYGSSGVSGVAKRITQPNKSVLTLYYKTFSHATSEITVTARLQSVASSNGYLLKLQYYSNTPGSSWTTRLVKATLINLAVNYCDPTADLCSGLTVAWPTLNYSYGSDPNPPIVPIDQATDSLGRTITYTGGPSISGIRSAEPTAEFVTIAYGGGRVSSITRGDKTWKYSWSLTAPLLTATITNPDQTQTVIVTDTSISQMKSEKNEINQTILYDYDAQGRLTFITYPEGNKLKYTYDLRGNVTERRAISKTPGTPPDIVVSAAYPVTCVNALTCNRPTSVTGANGAASDYTYDLIHGGVLTATGPAPTAGAVRPQSRYSYGSSQAYFKNSAGSIVASGQPTYLPSGTSACQTQASCAGTADEVKATISYGPQSPGTANNLLPVSASQGSGNNVLTATEASTYDSVGNLTFVDGPLAGAIDVTRLVYDAARQIVGQIGADPDGASALKNRAIRKTYNADGQVTKLERGMTAGQTDANWAGFAPVETIDIKYDSSGLASEQKLSGAGGAVSLTQISYDSMGRPECSAVRMNPAIYTSLPQSACSVGASGSHGADRITRASYDAAGRTTDAIAGFGTGNQASQGALTYTANGKIATLTDGQGHVTTNSYDGHDRLLKTQFPDSAAAGVSSTTDFEQFAYDAAGNVTSRRSRDGTSVGVAYDALNRGILKNLPGAELDVTYSFDNLGRLRSASQTGHNLTFTYDALSRNLTQSGPQGTVASSWDVAGRRTRLTYPGGGLYADFDYLVTGETTRIRENGAGSGVGVLATYTYDDLGNRTSLTRGNGITTSYAYGPASRLQTLTNLAGTANALTRTFTYNAAGQINSAIGSNDAFAWTGHVAVQRSHTINGLNQLTHTTSTGLPNPITFAYDGNGNLTQSGSTVFCYSSENLLISSGTNCAAPSVSLSYDPMLRLYQLTGSATKRFAYDGVDMIAEYDGANALQRRFIFGPGMDEPLVQYEGAGTADRRFISGDERGSVIALTDSAGALIGTNSYDYYGVPAGTNIGHFQYTGQAWLPELGIYYYKARIYSPTLGRFLQPDPIGYEAGANLYAYVRNDPINLVDPLGLYDQGCGPQGCPPPQGFGPDIVVIGHRRSSSGGFSGLFRTVGGLVTREISRRFERAIKDRISKIGKAAFCAVPSHNIGGDAALFRGLGARINAGATVNTATGQIYGNFTYSAGIGFGAGASAGAAAQFTAASAGNYGSIDSLLSGGRGFFGASASYNWANFIRGVRQAGSGFSGSVALGTKKYSGNYIAPLVASLTYSGLIGTMDTPCD